MIAPNNPQDVVATATDPTVPTKTKRKWSLKKKLLVAFGIIATLIIGLILIANAATAAPVKVSNQLVASIQAKNATQAYDLLSQEAKNATDPQTFLATVNQIGPILTGKPDMKSKEVNAQTGSASTAKVIYEIKGTDSQTYVFTVNLVKEGDNWKVLNFESTKKSGNTNTSSSSSLNLNKEVQTKCLAQVKDDVFCKFAGAFANINDYSAVMTSNSEGKTTVAKIDLAANGDSSMLVKVDGVSSAAIVSYGGSTYIQDPADQQWIKHAGSDNSISIPNIKKEFIDADFKNASGKADQYFNKGTETVDGIDCYKYQVIDADTPTDQGFMWFSKDTFLLHKITNKSADTEVSMTLSYNKVTIAQPSPVKVAQ
jgi:outer membrane lipoprotein-sorting protein